MSEWSTYLPDGRPVRIRHLDGAWTVDCEGIEAQGPDLRAVLDEATRPQVASIHAAQERQQLVAWIEKHAPQLEREAGF